MKVVSTVAEAYALVDHWRRGSMRIGLVPTMGALHEGHYSLVRRSVSECDLTVATIFVNPTQFGPHEDFGKYPRTLDEDLEGLKSAGAALVFTPSQSALYPEGFSTFIEPPSIAAILEGVHRPGHFRGVATIVTKLFQILPANVAYFGLKDYQQLVVIRRVVEDLNLPILIQPCETVRERDGLAMSSRNRYLSELERLAALSLHRALNVAEKMVTRGCCVVAEIEQAMEKELYASGANHIDYARLVDAETLATMTSLTQPCVALIAAFVGSTRLIDNRLMPY
ncbi:MAG: pantoate--beta-alanine ligase [Planctomycetales bacterium]|nr:pantoate--beta-alanine ligase [Planctomycetales bacterium]